MKFNLFPTRETAPAIAPKVDNQEFRAEREKLTTALHSLLETLPQSYSGRENVKLLCNEILGATTHLKFVWVGFCEGEIEQVTPYAAAGECSDECADWRLSKSCFDPHGPYSQAFPTASKDLDPLFVPWGVSTNKHSANAALAIPLRSEKRGLRGLIVFYADERDYFTHLGVPIFQAFCHVAEIIWKQSNLLNMLAQKAQQDPLTGLMNRRQTMVALEQAITDSERVEQPLSILICRVEGFNKLNDLYGWLAADNILATFSKEVAAQISELDNGGRWTGVEFLYILRGFNSESTKVIATRLKEHFAANPIAIKTWSIRLALKVGIATYSRQSIGLDDLIQNATHNMLSASDELPSSTP